MRLNAVRRGAVVRCVLAGLLAVLLGWGAAAVVLGATGRLVLTTPVPSHDILARVARLNVAWTASLGAPLEIRPLAEGAADVVTCSGRVRLALAPLVLLASLGLLAGGALLARWEGCRDARSAILTGSSAALPAAVTAGLMSFLASPPLCVPLGGLWGRLAEVVSVRPLDAAGAVLTCGLVAGATGGMLASAGRRPGEEGRTTWGLLGRALVAGLVLVGLSVPAGLASLATVWATPDVRQSLALLEKVDLQELPRAGDLLALTVGFAGQSPVMGCGGRVQGDMVVAVVPGPGEASADGAQAHALLGLCGGFHGEAPIALPSSVRAGVLLPLLVAVVAGWRAGSMRRRERVAFGLACSCVLVGAGLWLSTWCDLVVAMPGVLPGLRLWGWWRADLPSLALGAALFGMMAALAVPRWSRPGAESPR